MPMDKICWRIVVANRRYTSCTCGNNERNLQVVIIDIPFLEQNRGKEPNHIYNPQWKSNKTWKSAIGEPNLSKWSWRPDRSRTTRFTIRSWGSALGSPQEANPSETTRLPGCKVPERYANEETGRKAGPNQLSGLNNTQFWYGIKVTEESRKNPVRDEIETEP